MWPRKFELLRAPEGAQGGTGGAGAPAGGGAPSGGATAPPSQGGAPPSGGAAAPWYGNGLDTESVQFIESKKIDGLPTLIKQATHWERHARERNVMNKPDPNNLMAWDGFGELGYVADLGAYSGKIPKPDGGQVVNDEFWQGILKVGHDNKVPPVQLQALANFAIKWGNDQAQAHETRIAGEVATAEADLRKEWGNDYPAKREIAKRAFQLIGIGADDTRHLDQVLGAPRLVKAFAKLGELLGEEQLPQGGGGAVGFGRAPSTITAELKKFEQDNIAIIKDRRSPLYEDTMARRQRLIDELERAQRPGRA